MKGTFLKKLYLAQVFRCPLSVITSTIVLSFFVLSMNVIIIYFCSLTTHPFDSILPIAFLVVLWLVASRPRLAVLFVFLSAGLPSLQFSMPGHTIRPVELSLFLCLILICIIRPPFRPSIPHLLALLFLAIAFISFLHAPEFSTSATIYGANKRLYNIIIILLALFCGTALVNLIPDTSSLLSSILLSNVPLYLISLAQALRVSLPSFLSPDQNPALTGDGGRIVGPFDGAATFGIYLTGLFALSLSCSLLGIHRRDRAIGTFMLLTTSLSLIGSGTRSALVAAGVMLLVAATITRHFKLLLGFVALAISGFVLFPNVILSHFTHAETSTSNRVFLWHEALKLIVAHPIIGIGLEQFHYYYERLIISQSSQLNQHGISIHNQYLEWAVEGGILWSVLGILFLFSVVIFCARNYVIANRQQRLLLLAAMLGVLATIITGFLDVPFDDVEHGVFLCMLAGLAVGCNFYPLSLLKMFNSRKKHFLKDVTT